LIEPELQISAAAAGCYTFLRIPSGVERGAARNKHFLKMVLLLRMVSSSSISSAAHVVYFFISV
jgi:hypothetical protein